MAVSCKMSYLGTVAGDGDTLRDVNAAWMTAIAAVPEISDDGSVAVMTAAPVTRPETTPDADTVAFPGLEDDHDTVLVRSDVDPSEYSPVAVNCAVAPTGTFAAGGVTTTATSTAGNTVITAVPDRSAAESVAVIVAAPIATPVTKPEADTVAAPVSDDDHVTVLVRSAVEPSEYTPVAVSCWVSPAGTFATGGVTTTATNTAGKTVITAVPEISDDGSVAVIVAAPIATPVTKPDDDTDAVVALDEDHVTVSVRSAVEPSE